MMIYPFNARESKLCSVNLEDLVVEITAVAEMILSVRMLRVGVWQGVMG